MICSFDYNRLHRILVQSWREEAVLVLTDISLYFLLKVDCTKSVSFCGEYFFFFVDSAVSIKLSLGFGFCITLISRF